MDIHKVIKNEMQPRIRRVVIDYKCDIVNKL